jgi:hypothetical protein
MQQNLQVTDYDMHFFAMAKPAIAATSLRPSLSFASLCVIDEGLFSIGVKNLTATKTGYFVIVVSSCHCGMLSYALCFNNQSDQGDERREWERRNYSLFKPNLRFTVPPVWCNVAQ